jgi:hypothetical protein
MGGGAIRLVHSRTSQTSDVGFDSIARPKTIEGTVTKDAVVYSESLPGGPGVQVLDQVESGTHFRVIRLDSIYANGQVRAPNGITGWINIGDVSY